MKSQLYNIGVTRKDISGFPYAILVWAYETIPLLKNRGYATRVARTSPRILNWLAVEQPSWEELEEAIFTIKKGDRNINLETSYLLVLIEILYRRSKKIIFT